jgi:hypothetical protein
VQALVPDEAGAVEGGAVAEPERVERLADGGEQVEAAERRPRAKR